MAWSSTDMTARWRTDWEQDMASIAEAINDREAALGVAFGSQTQFHWTGGMKVSPSASELSGLTLHKEFEYNLKIAQDATIALLNRTRERFVTASNGTTVYTQSSMETTVGLGAFPATPEVNNGNDWERIREALVRMIYLQIYPIEIEADGFTKEYGEDDPYSPISEQNYLEGNYLDTDIWAGTLAESEVEGTSSPGLVGFGVRWATELTVNGSGNVSRAVSYIAKDALIYFDTEKYSGSVPANGVFWFTKYRNIPDIGGNPRLAIAFDIEIAGSAQSIGTGGSIVQTTHSMAMAATVASDTTVYLEMVDPYPANAPFTSEEEVSPFDEYTIYGEVRIAGYALSLPFGTPPTPSDSYLETVGTSLRFPLNIATVIDH